MRESTHARVRTVEEAEREGFTIDRHCYPWVGYKGPRFDPTCIVTVATPAVTKETT